MNDIVKVSNEEDDDEEDDVSELQDENKRLRRQVWQQQDLISTLLSGIAADSFKNSKRIKM